MSCMFDHPSLSRYSPNALSRPPHDNKELTARPWLCSSLSLALSPISEPPLDEGLPVPHQLPPAASSVPCGPSSSLLGPAPSPAAWGLAASAAASRRVASKGAGGACGATCGLAVSAALFAAGTASADADVALRSWACTLACLSASSASRAWICSVWVLLAGGLASSAGLVEIGAVSSATCEGDSETPGWTQKPRISPDLFWGSCELPPFPWTLGDRP
jgi:hypothetical protein